MPHTWGHMEAHAGWTGRPGVRETSRQPHCFLWAEKPRHTQADTPVGNEKAVKLLPEQGFPGRPRPTGMCWILWLEWGPSLVPLPMPAACGVSVHIFYVPVSALNSQPAGWVGGSRAEWRKLGPWFRAHSSLQCAAGAPSAVVGRRGSEGQSPETSMGTRGQGSCRTQRSEGQMQGEPGWHLIPGRLRQAQKSQVGQDWKGGSQRKAGVHPGGSVWEDPLHPPSSSNHALTQPRPLQATPHQPHLHIPETQNEED